MVEDKVSNLINSLKNAGNAGKDYLVFPYTKYIHSILETLAKEGFIESVTLREKNSIKDLRIDLKYNDEGKSVISGVKRISKNSKRVYKNTKEIKPTKNNYGVSILTTPMGILSGKNSKDKKVGGELLFEIW